MIDRVRAFSALSRTRRRLLASTTVLLLATEGLLSVRILSLRTVRWTVRLLTRLLFPDGISPVEPAEVAWAVDVATGFLPDSVTCLRRAVVAQSILERGGHSSRMRIGVLKRDTEFRAHAWVEYDGRVLVGELDDLSQYVALPTDEVGL